MEDKRKAKLDRWAAEAAQALLDEAKARSTAAGTEVAKNEQLRLMTIDDLASETDSDKKAALSQKIKDYEAEIARQKVLKEEADTEVTRLNEASKNAETLARIADETAALKESTDTIIEGFVAERDALLEGVERREVEILDLQDAIETYKYEYERETDAKAKLTKKAIWDAALNNVEAKDIENQNATRLASQYDV